MNSTSKVKTWRQDMVKRALANHPLKYIGFDRCLASLPSGLQCPNKSERDGYCRHHSTRACEYSRLGK
jgi:hypothetical protein